MSEIPDLVKRRITTKDAFAANQMTLDQALAQLREALLSEDEIAELLVEATAAQPIVTATPRTEREALRVHAQAIAHCKKYGGTWILDHALRVTASFLKDPAD